MRLFSTVSLSLLVGLMVPLAACGDSGQDAQSGSAGGGATAGGGGSGGSGAGDTGGGPELSLGDPMDRLDEVDDSNPHYLQSRIDGDTLFICTARQGLQSFDVSDPSAVTRLDAVTFSMSQRCQYLTLHDDSSLIYVTQAEDQINPQPLIAVVNVANPQSMNQDAVYPRNEQLAGLDYDNQLLAVAAKDAGVLLFEAQDENLNELASFAVDDAWNVALANGTAFITAGAGGLVVVDVSDPTMPTQIGSLELAGIAKDLVLDGDRAYVALGGEGVAAVDISDPSAPLLLDHETTPGSAIAIAMSPEQNGLFVADWNDIRLFDISNRDDLYLLGREPLPLAQDRESRTMGIAARGEYVFGSNWDVVNSYRFNAGVAAPDLMLVPGNLMLPDTMTGETNAGVVILSNDSPMPMTTLSVSAESGLSISGAPDTLQPYETAVAEVSFTAQSNQPFSATVTLASDDPDQPSQSLDVSANQPGLGVGDPVPEWQYFDMDNNPVGLADYSGQVKLLAYFATF